MDRRGRIHWEGWRQLCYVMDGRLPSDLRLARTSELTAATLPLADDCILLYLFSLRAAWRRTLYHTVYSSFNSSRLPLTPAPYVCLHPARSCLVTISMKVVAQIELTKYLHQLWSRRSVIGLVSPSGLIFRSR
jgi:hypothetical protein